MNKESFCILLILLFWGLDENYSFGQTIFQADSKGNQIRTVFNGPDPCQMNLHELSSTINALYKFPEEGFDQGQNIQDVLDPSSTAKPILRAFPNPSKGLINIEYAIPYNGQIEINIYDLSGKLVKQVMNGFQNERNYKTTIDMSVLPSGIYHCVLVSALGVESLKLVKN